MRFKDLTSTYGRVELSAVKDETLLSPLVDIQITKGSKETVRIYLSELEDFLLMQKADNGTN